MTFIEQVRNKQDSFIRSYGLAPTHLTVNHEGMAELIKYQDVRTYTWVVLRRGGLIFEGMSVYFIRAQKENIRVGILT